jgi:hypothetical protein
MRLLAKRPLFLSILVVLVPFFIGAQTSVSLTRRFKKAWSICKAVFQREPAL